MADDTVDDRLRRHDEILNGLYAMMVEQQAMQTRLEASYEELLTMSRQQRDILQELREFTREQRAMNQQQVAINTDIKTTLAGIQALLDHVLRGGTNGGDA